MRPSRVTCVASIIMRPAPLYESCPRWTRCQSFMQPSSAWYWHIGEMTIRLGSVTPPSWSGVKSLGSGNFDLPFFECLPEGFREGRGAGLVAVDAQCIGRDRHPLSGETGDVALLDHRQRLLHGLVGVFDHAARLVARRERAVVGVAAVGEHLAAHRDAGALRDVEVLALRQHI